MNRKMTIALSALSAWALTTGCTPEQHAVRDLVNDSRTTAGLPELAWDVNLNVKAQDWAEHLAAARSLAHSRLSEDVPPGWTILGENVGVGPDIEAVHEAYLESAPHRANILDQRFDRIGTGHAEGSCPRVDATCVYTVQVFARY